MARRHTCNNGVKVPGIRCRACEDSARGWVNSHPPKQKTLRKPFLPLKSSVSPFPQPGNTVRSLKRIVNHVALVIDESGSMRWATSLVNKAYRETLQHLRSEARANDQETYLTLITFGDTVRIEHRGLPIMSSALDNYYHKSPGNTALLDALGDAVSTLDQQTLYGAFVDQAFLVIVLTDGQENASKRYSQQFVQNLIHARQNSGQWTFAMQMPPGNRTFAEKLGVPSGNVREWEQTTYGFGETVSATTQGYSNYTAARSLGRSAVQSFYVQTDLSGLQPKDLKDKLKNLTGEFNRPVAVPKEMSISEFVNSIGGPYISGKSFYQLTKKEKVQAGKELLIMEKGKRDVFGGSTLRSMIGLPYSAEATVDPGNHANFDLFVQSTSTNRKLVRGTKVITKK